MSQPNRYRARQGCILTVAGIRVTDNAEGVELPLSDLVADHVRMKRLVLVAGSAKPTDTTKAQLAKESSPAKPNKEPQS